MTDGKECHGTLSALKGMFSFFTMLPVNLTQKNIDDMNAKFWLVPVIGLFYGLLALLIFYPLSYVSPLIAAAVALFCMAAMNRFLHLDGTIDVGDGLTVAGKREDHLRALKDTLIGAGGMATGAFVILITFSEYASLTVSSFICIGVTAEIFARNAQVAAAGFGTAGNGMAGASVRATKRSDVILSSLLSLLFAALWCYFAVPFILGLAGFARPDLWTIDIILIIATSASVIWGILMSRIAQRNFGMVNGDVLGATNESSRAVILFALILFVWAVGGL
jgi:adenosylcobinamide-GDP ribazoletransferase